MKQFLRYNYNLNNPTIYRVNNEIRIKDEDKRYILQPVHRFDELEEIYTLLKHEKIEEYYYKIIKTKTGNLSALFKEKNYVLLDCSEETSKVKNKPQIISGQYHSIEKNNWRELWIRKQEYYNNIMKNNKINVNSQYIYDYYNGMAETAIMYLIDMDDSKKNRTINHKFHDSEKISNPLNIVLDVEERDIGEEIRKEMLREDSQNNSDEFDKIIKKYTLAKIDLSKVFARLLFPNYYFDNLLNEKNQEKRINNTITDIVKYEKKLKIIYEEFNKIKKIKKIDWL